MTIFEEIRSQAKNIFLWAPVFLACGIGLYFSLLKEPVFFIAPLVFCLCAVFVFLCKGREIQVVGVACALVALGFCAAQLRTYSVYTPVYDGGARFSDVTGTIEMVEDTGEGDGLRLIIADMQIENLPPERTPRKIRVTLRKGDEMRVGQRIKGLAQLHAPSQPLVPEGFDFRRYLYFQGIGAVGFMMGTPEIVPTSHSSFPFASVVARARSYIATRIEAHLPPEDSGVAMALVMGGKTAISDADNQAMRASGLAHMLAISGLHLGLLSGAVFFFVRLCFVLIPGMALRYPVKKYAAVIAIIAAGIYMLLAGANIPAVRAFLMTGVIFLAIIFDRSPISLRLVSFSACVVLLLFPDSLLSASFQLSFAAVTCLIVFYDWLRPFWSNIHRRAGKGGHRIWLYFLGVSITSIIATIATTPFALFHFQQAALYGLVANFLAVPVLAFFIMPLVALALFLMPFGADIWAFKSMHLGIQAVLKIAHYVAELPYSVFLTGMWPVGFVSFLTLGFLFFALWAGRMRWLGLLMMALSVLYGIRGMPQPDILISPEFDLIGIKPAGEKILLLSNPKKNGFTREQWLQSMALKEENVRPWPKEGKDEFGFLICDAQACRADIRGFHVSFLFAEDAVRTECAWADIDMVIADFPLRGACGDIPVVDKSDVKRHGAHGVWFHADDRKESQSIKIQSANEYARYRPWGGVFQK